jgi:hypothetical protein
MRPLYPRVLSLALASVVLAESVAFAQPRPPSGSAAPSDVRSQLSDDARRAWDAAKELSDDNNFAGALVEFKKAQQISGNPRIGLNIGLCEKALLHYSRAIDAWQRELDDASGKLSASEIAELKNAIDVVSRYVTSITVTTNQDGAALFVDEQASGTTPLAGPVRIDVGKHRLRLTKAGFTAAEQEVDVAAGPTTAVTLRLEPTAAVVTVTVLGAPGAIVYVDRVDRGRAPFKGALPGGTHSVEARAPGFSSTPQSVLVEGQPKDIVLSLSPDRHEGKLHVVAPEDAALVLDNKPIGTGSWEGNVSSTGSHELVVRKPGFQVYATDINVRDDEKKDFNVYLTKEVSTSWVVWGAGALLLTAGCIAVAVFVFKPADVSPYRGDLLPGLTTARYGLHF